MAVIDVPRSSVFKADYDFNDVSGGSDTVTILHFTLDPGGNLTTLADDLMQAAIDNKWWGQDCLLENVRVTDLTNTFSQTSALAAEDGIASPSLPANNALLVNKVALGITSREKGRSFWTGALRNDYGYAGLLGAPQVAARQAQFDSFFTDFQAVSAVDTMVYPLSRTPTGPGNVWVAEVVQLVVDRKVAVQRRRLRT